MNIIISPAKQMRIVDDFYSEIQTQPLFETQANQLVQQLQDLTYDQYKAIMKCSDKIALPAYENIQNFDFNHQKSPAILSYSGIQYQYMAPEVFTDQQIEYVQNHLFILSGLYGILRPLDNIQPYRLEMQAKLNGSLYQFWGDKLARCLEKPILNLASEEYAKCIRKYKAMIDVRFCQEENGKLIEKGVYAKMARGSMVRYMAEHNATEISQLYNFNELGYIYHPEHSTDTLLSYIKKD